MAQAKRDENRITSGLAFDGTTTQPLKVDPVTGRLLIAIDIVSSTSPANSRTLAKHDDNCEPTALVVDDNGDYKNLLVDSRNGSLWCDILVE